MRVVITGATGFVGANLARRLLADGHAVTALVRPGYAGWRIADLTDLRVEIVDLAEGAAARAIMAQIKPEWTFHLAVHGAYSQQTDTLQMVQTNLVGTINLFNAHLDAGGESFINTGSSSEYGFKDHAPREDEFVEPNSDYAVTKVAATHYVRKTARARGAHAATLRLYSVYGAYEEPSRLMPTLIARGLRGELPPLVNPSIARDYVYMDDVEDAYLLAAAVKTDELGAVYNVGTGVQTSLGDVVETARAALQIAAEPFWGSMPDRAWDTSVWVADNTKIRERLGWSPRVGFADGFAAMAEWLATTPALHTRYDVRA